MMSSAQSPFDVIVISFEDLVRPPAVPLGFRCCLWFRWLHLAADVESLAETWAGGPLRCKIVIEHGPLIVDLPMIINISNSP